MPRRPEGVDTSVPNIARMYDYYLGGKDNFEADLVAAEEIMPCSPSPTAASPSGVTCASPPRCSPIR